MKARLFFVSFLVLSQMGFTSLHAAQKPWVDMGPGGGMVVGMAQSSQNPDMVYTIFSDNERIYKSTDFAESWEYVANWKETVPRTSFNVIASEYKLLIDSHDDDVLYINLNAYEYIKSTDGGLNWTLFEGKTDSVDAEGSTWYFYNIVDDMIADPQQPNVLHAVGQKTRGAGTPNPNAYFKSLDGGVSWTAYEMPLFNGLESERILFTCIAVNPMDNNMVFFGARLFDDNTKGSRGVVLKTMDGGTTFSDITGDIQGIPNNILVDTRSVPYVHPSLNFKGFLYIGTSRADQMVASPCGLYRSRDFGETPVWEQGSGNSEGYTQIDGLALDYSNLYDLYAKTGSQTFSKYIGNGIDSNGNIGGNFKQTFNDRLTASRASHIFVHPDAGKLIMDSQTGVVKSTDSGENWAWANRGMDAITINTFKLVPSDPNQMKMCIDRGIYYGTLNGANGNFDFEHLWNPFFYASAVNDFLLSPDNPDAVSAVFDLSCGSEVSALNISNDNGETWTTVPSVMADAKVLMYGSIYQGGSIASSHNSKQMAVIKSDDDGSNVIESILSDHQYGIVNAIATHPENGNVVYAGGLHGTADRVHADWENVQTTPGLYKTIDGCETWTEIGLTLGGTTVNALCIDSGNYDLIYAGTDTGVYASPDAGLTWNAPSDTLHVLKMVQDPDRAGRLFAGTPYGVFESRNGGSTWTAMNDGLNSLVVTSMDVDKFNGLLYVGFERGNIFQYDLAINPEIDIAGNSVSIVSGDDTPDASDHTNFGSVMVGSGTKTVEFTLTNSGDDALNLTGDAPYVLLSGDAASDFTVETAPAAEIQPGESTSFTLLFSPSVEGVRTAEVQIASNDADEALYSFIVQGTGTVMPVFSINSQTDGDGSGTIQFSATEADSGTWVVVTAVADEGSDFVEWSGDLTGSNNPDSLLMDGDRTVTAKFELLSTAVLADAAIPKDFNLHQNYPNPFNPETSIRFDLPTASEVQLSIYNSAGQKVAELYNQKMSAGAYKTQWHAASMPSGIYVVELVTESFVKRQKMMLLK